MLYNALRWCSHVSVLYLHNCCDHASYRDVRSPRTHESNWCGGVADWPPPPRPRPRASCSSSWPKLRINSLFDRGNSEPRPCPHVRSARRKIVVTLLKCQKLRYFNYNTRDIRGPWGTGGGDQWQWRHLIMITRVTTTRFLSATCQHEGADIIISVVRTMGRAGRQKNSLLWSPLLWGFSPSFLVWITPARGDVEMSHGCFDRTLGTAASGAFKLWWWRWCFFNPRQ